METRTSFATGKEVITGLRLWFGTTKKNLKINISKNGPPGSKQEKVTLV